MVSLIKAISHYIVMARVADPFSFDADPDLDPAF
jgi:hypothetical protein